MSRLGFGTLWKRSDQGQIMQQDSRGNLPNGKHFLVSDQESQTLPWDPELPRLDHCSEHQCSPVGQVGLGTAPAQHSID